MNRLRLRLYLPIAVLVAAVPLVWALVWGQGASTAVLSGVLFVALVLEVMLAVWALVSSGKDQTRAVEGKIEKARSQIDWRIQYEAATLFKSLKALHQDNVAGWHKMSDHPQGARRQGDRAVKALNAQGITLLKQEQDLAAVRELIVELVARVDSVPETAGTHEKLASPDRG